MSSRNSRTPYHQCKLTQAEREEVNNPEEYPGISWTLERYKNGYMWVRKVKPTYGCSNDEQKSGDCICAGGHRHRPTVIDLDKHMVDDNTCPPITITPSPVAKHRPVPGFLQRFFSVKQEQFVDNTEYELGKTHSRQTWEYLVKERDTFNEWGYNFPSHVIEKRHPIIRVVNHLCGTQYTDFNISAHDMHRVWLEVLGTPTVKFNANNAREYQQLCRPMMAIAKQIITFTEIQHTPVEVELMSSTVYQCIKFVNDKWTIQIGDMVHEVKLGGLPRDTQLVVEPFYRFDSNGLCQIKITKGTITPVTLTIGNDFKLKEVSCTDTGEHVGSFSVCEGHVLLDLIIVQVQASSILNGN